MIKFSQLTENIPYPRAVRATLSTLHSDVITYGMERFQNTRNFKSRIIDILNTISFYVISGDSLPSEWSAVNPLENIDVMDSSAIQEDLGDIFIAYKDIIWDVSESEVNITDSISKSPSTTPESVTSSPTMKKSTAPSPTPKEHLYIKPPTIPQFDVNKIWLNVNKDGNEYVIYRSLPLIPQNQSQISVTTDINEMTSVDLLKLYPNHFIKTRAAVMYEPYDGLTLDPDIGIILPIMGFTEQQVRDNIIKYPHFFKLQRILDSKGISFYSNIEIDGVLYNTLDVWDSLPDSNLMPKNSDYIKEYVVRRYLLERDILHIEHKYPLFGTLEPFLTLFTTPADYSKFGYDNSVELAKLCVNARVSYKQSRNPILRAVYNTQ